MVELQVRKGNPVENTLLFCSMMGCRTSGIDLQVGKFDTRQGKSTREVGKMREQGINDSPLSYSRLCLKYESS